MAHIYTIHAQNPQPRIVEQIKAHLESGAVILYPTDTVYAIGCDLRVKSAVQKVRQIKQIADDKPLTFLCSSLRNIAQYAVVNDAAYRLMKHCIPGPYTFILPATKLVPKLVMNPKRKTTGIRVPNHPICQALLTALGTPIISTSAPNLKKIMPLSSRIEFFEQYHPWVDGIIDDGSEPGEDVSTIVDLTDDQPLVIREGLGWDYLNNWL